MQRHLRPSIEAMESKALLSSMAPGLSVHHSVHVAPTDSRMTSSHLQLSLTTNQSTYAPGQVVQMTFTITNDSGRVVMVPEGPSIDSFSVTHDGKTVWRSNPVGPDFIGLHRLMPGQSLAVSADWKAPAAAGSYVAHNRMGQNLAASFTVAAASSNTGTPTPTPTPTPVSTNPPATLQPLVVLTDPPSATSVNPPGSSSPSATGSVVTSVTTNQSSYAPGQQVEMTFTETNGTGNVVEVVIGPSIDGFYVTDGSKTVWRSNSVAPDYVMVRKLQPGQSITLTADWTAPNAAGTYVAHNQLVPDLTASFTVAGGAASPPGTLSPLGSTAV
jgi:hypothetical protein